jgi:hypothetical protein
LAAVLGTLKAVFPKVGVTDVVAAAWLDTAIGSALFGSFIGADAVPLDGAAVVVELANARLNFWVLTAHGAVRFATIALA